MGGTELGGMVPRVAEKGQGTGTDLAGMVAQTQGTILCQDGEKEPVSDHGQKVERG